MKSKSTKDLISFMAFCSKHKDLEFWDALARWQGVAHIYTQKEGEPVNTAFDERGREVEVEQLTLNYEN